MKTKIVSSILILLIICFINTTSNAVDSGTIYLDSSSSEVEKGKEIEIRINLKDTTTAAFDLILHFDNNKWDYISNIENTNIQDDQVLYVWYDIIGGESAKQGELVSFKFRAKEEGLSTFSVDGNFYNSEGQIINVNYVEKQVQITKENDVFKNKTDEKKDSDEAHNAYLQVLRLDVDGITPDFNKDIFEYYLTVSNSIKNIDVLAISENQKSTIDISGNTNLKEGVNTIRVKVISEDKREEKIYTIYVTKSSNIALANSNLEILAIENILLNPPFDASITKYKAEVSNSTKDLNIFAVPEYETASVKIDGGTNLKEGKNTVTVTVTATNGLSIKKYTIEVYKRNEEEQIEYNEEQNKQAEKLEEAYEIEKTSTKYAEEIKEQDNIESKGSSVWIVIIIGILIVLIGITLWYFKYKHRKTIIFLVFTKIIN